MRDDDLTGTKISMFITPRDEAFQLRDQFKAAIEQVIGGGDFPPNTPWGDARFQQMIMHTLRTIRPLRVEAHNLAVIKEVFGK